MKKLLLILLSSLLFISCSRKVALQKSVLKDNSVEVYKAIDTSFTITQTNEKDYVDYGDTLQAVLNTLADSTISSDNFESNGIKIIATTTKLKNGVVQTRLTAIAKPKQQVNEKQTITTEHKGISTTDSSKKDIVITTKEKQTEKKDYTIIIVAICFIVALLGFGLYICGQLKKWW